MRIEDGQQGQANARLIGRGDDPLGHLGYVRVVTAVHVVMQVVELADAGIACLEHLQIGPRRDGLELVGVEHAGQRVHAAAPGPEVVGTGGGVRAYELGAAGQRPLMGVRMQIDHARQHVAIEALDVVVPMLRLLRVDRGDHAVVADLDVSGREPTLRLVQVRHAVATSNSAGHHASRSTTISPRLMTVSTAFRPSR